MRPRHAASGGGAGTTLVSKISSGLRRRVRRRAQGLCEYCRSRVELTGHDFTVDHVHPNRKAAAAASRTCVVAASGATPSNKLAPNGAIRAQVVEYRYSIRE